MFNGVCEEWIVLTPSDFVRSIDAPSRRVSVLQHSLALVRNWWRGSERLSAATLNYRGSARVSAWQDVGIEYICGFIKIKGLSEGASPHQSRPRAHKVHTPKKYSPPYPLDTKGCCSPQNNPKNLRCYTGPGFRAFQMICLSIVPVGLATSRENASFSPCLRNLFIEWVFTRSRFWRFEYISSLLLLSPFLSLTGNY